MQESWILTSMNYDKQILATVIGRCRTMGDDSSLYLRQGK